jgi:hypothetical protein
MTTQRSAATACLALGLAVLILPGCKPNSDKIVGPGAPSNATATGTTASQPTPSGATATQGLPAIPPGRDASQVPDVPGAGSSPSGAPVSNGPQGVAAGSAGAGVPGVGTAGGLAPTPNAGPSNQVPTGGDANGRTGQTP